MLFFGRESLEDLVALRNWPFVLFVIGHGQEQDVIVMWKLDYFEGLEDGAIGD
jgi:hypothetical protein